MRHTFPLVSTTKSSHSFQYLAFRLACHFPVLSLYGTTLDPGFYRRDDTAWDLSGLESNSHWIVKFLYDSCKSHELSTQLRYFGSLDPTTRDLFAETIFSNELLIAYARIHHASECAGCAFYDPWLCGIGTFIAEATVMIKCYIE